MIIVLAGPPGCGKGTQSMRLVSKLGIAHMSTGDVLREAISAETPVGKRVAAVLRDGKLVSDELIMELVSEHLQAPAYQAGVLLDGVPRTLAQAQAMDKLLSRQGAAVDAAITIDVDDEELTRRILQRAEVEGRTDDTPETFRQRLEVFRSETAPVLEHYERTGVLRRVDGRGARDEVFARIVAALPTA